MLQCLYINCFHGGVSYWFSMKFLKLKGLWNKQSYSIRRWHQNVFYIELRILIHHNKPGEYELVCWLTPIRVSGASVMWINTKQQKDTYWFESLSGVIQPSVFASTPPPPPHNSCCNHLGKYIQRLVFSYYNHLCCLLKQQ